MTTTTTIFTIYFFIAAIAVFSILLFWLFTVLAQSIKKTNARLISLEAEFMLMDYMLKDKHEATQRINEEKRHPKKTTE